MSETPEMDPYRPPGNLGPDASALRPAAWVTVLGRMMAFLDSPRRAMRNVLDHASPGSAIPLAALWGMQNTLSRGWRTATSAESTEEVVAAVVGLALAGAIMGNLGLLWFASFVRLTAWMLSIPIRFRDAILVLGWAAVPQVVMLIVGGVYLLLGLSGVLQPTDSSVFNPTLAEWIFALLSLAMGLLQLSICVTGLSEASGKTVGRGALLLVLSVLLGVGIAMLLVQMMFRLLTG